MAAEAFCPYVGLVPYTEDDARFFFGRERETRQVVANLFASRLTLLYGASGVGKSSVLRAGVLHELESRTARAAAQGEKPEQVAVYLKEWEGDVASRFREALRQAIDRAFPGEGDAVESEAELVDALDVASARLGVDLLVILDQFEEYFLYHGDEIDEAFARQLAAAINRPGLAASFLISLRDDALARLDRFKASIPRLFSNYLRLRPLAGEAAGSALVEPVAVYNQLPVAKRGDVHVRVEPELVSAVIRQVTRGRVQVGEGGLGGAASAESGIEAAFLQLVMTRVWEAELAAGSFVLRQATLTELGGAETIVHGHLDRVMADLSSGEHRICARIFQHLVTPSGAKIAHTAQDLAGFGQVESARMEHLLARVSGSGMRVLTPVAPADAVGAVRYEIYHDALAQAMLEWRRRYLEERERKELAAEAERQRAKFEKERLAARRLRRLAVGLAVFVALALAAMGFAWYQMQRAKENAQLATEKELEAKAAAQQITELADANALEERKRLAAEASAAEKAGELEKAAELRDIVARSQQAAEERSQILAQLGDREQTRADEVERRLKGVQTELDMERSRADEAERRLKRVQTELDTERAWADEADKKWRELQEERDLGRTSIDDKDSTLTVPRETYLDGESATLKGESEVTTNEPAPLPNITAGSSDWRANFVAGLRAHDSGRWDDLVDYMQKAIARNPNPKGELVRVYGMKFERYAPYSYLGVGLYNQGKCKKALEVFEKARAEEAFSLRLVNEMKKLEQECQNK